MKFLLLFFAYPAYANSLLVFLLPVELLCSPCVPCVPKNIVLEAPGKKGGFNPGSPFGLVHRPLSNLMTDHHPHIFSSILF